jgi:4'-phosphopantetheinyl transferase
VTAVRPRNFAIGHLQCLWQALPQGVRAQDIAADWLRAVAGDAAADGLRRDARGRPCLAQGDAGWSHSYGRLLLAHAAHGRIGVDIEPLARRADSLRIARRFFAAEEIATLDALDGDARQSAFLRLWCAKEAVLKAHGGGIAFGLHKAVFDATGDGLRMLRCDPALGRVYDWRLDLLEPEPEFIAVLASTA